LPLPDLCVTALKIRGTAIEPRNFSRSFDRCITVARVPRITVHGTRKTCASLLAALDVHPRVAMRILRHSKIEITIEVYTKAPSQATRDALHHEQKRPVPLFGTGLWAGWAILGSNQ
jgi:integrase